MKNIKRKIFLIFIFLFLIPATVSASQILPPEIPVLFYGRAEINDKPADVNTVVSVKIKADNIEIASSTVKIAGEYFIEIPCENYVDKNMVFSLGDLAGGQHECHDVQITPSVKFDLTVFSKKEKEGEKEEDESPKINSSGNSLVWLINQKNKEEKNKEIIALGISAYADGSLLRGKDGRIYLIDRGFKIYISTLKKLLEFEGQAIYNVDNEELAKYKNKKYFINDLIREQSKTKIFVITNSGLRHILSLQELRLKHFRQEIFNVSRKEMVLYE
ncbi:hypothetical protein KAJ61_02920 [Candidatus Parcubacteria bacterium]|nr:hypothetical protein [Candidatus Parcubacteria bacterium]